MPRRAKRDCAENPLEKGQHAPDLRKLAEYSIETFFEDKQWFCGGPIPQKELLSEESIRIVLRTQNDDETFLFIHEKCLEKLPKPRGHKDGNVPWTVQFLLSLISDMKKKWLPKDFQPGLLLLYFKFCKGQQIPPAPLL